MMLCDNESVSKPSATKIGSIENTCSFFLTFETGILNNIILQLATISVCGPGNPVGSDSHFSPNSTERNQRNAVVLVYSINFNSMGAMLMSIPQCITLEIPNTLSQFFAYKTLTEYFRKFQ